MGPLVGGCQNIMVSWLLDRESGDPISSDQMKELIDAGANFTNPAPSGALPIHQYMLGMAQRPCSVECVRLMLDAWPTLVNLRSQLTETPVMLCSRYIDEATPMLRLLLERGAVVELQDYKGGTAITNAASVKVKEFLGLHKIGKQCSCGCGTLAPRAKCGGCLRAFYVDATHQKQHWPSHKKLCASLKALDFNRPPQPNCVIC